MTDQEDLHYPHLDGCKATLTSTSGGSRPPVQLPIECRSAVHVPIPSIYDFSVEKSVMKKKEERELDITATKSRDELERQVLVKMKSVTGAEDDVCVAMLENNGYDLKTSIEAFFQSK